MQPQLGIWKRFIRSLLGVDRCSLSWCVCATYLCPNTVVRTIQIHPSGRMQQYTSKPKPVHKPKRKETKGNDQVHTDISVSQSRWWVVQNGNKISQSVLSYISGLCTAAVERQELHKDNMFTLNSVSCSESQYAEHLTYVINHFFHNDEYSMLLVATI